MTIVFVATQVAASPIKERRDPGLACGLVCGFPQTFCGECSCCGSTDLLGTNIFSLISG